MNEQTKKAIRKEIEVVEKKYPNKDAKSVLYLAIRHVIRRENPKISGKERYNLQKELFNEMEEDNMEQIVITFVGLRHNRGEENLNGLKMTVKEFRGSENLVLVNGDGVTVGSMLGSVYKRNELIALGVSEDALTLQSEFRGIKSSIASLDVIEIENYINGECITVIVGQKGGDNMINVEKIVVDVPQYAINSDKIIGYDEEIVEKCLSCGNTVTEGQNYCTQCGAKLIREEVSSSQNNEGGDDMVILPTLTKNIVMEKVRNGEISSTILEMDIDSIDEAFDIAMREYTLEMIKILPDTSGDGLSQILQAFRGLDDLMAKKYLNDEISGGEFDHVRTWITLQGYIFYSHNIEEIEHKEFFTADSMLASKKFLRD